MERVGIHIVLADPCVAFRLKLGCHDWDRHAAICKVVKLPHFLQSLFKFGKLLCILVGLIGYASNAGNGLGLGGLHRVFQAATRDPHIVDSRRATDPNVVTLARKYNPFDGRHC